MNILEMLIWGFCIVFCLMWFLMFLQAFMSVIKIPRFEKLKLQDNTKLPKLSIVVAACNEADTIEKALPTLLSQNYPDFEVIVVNDRSTDSTGKILNQWQEKHANLKVVHIDDLPPKWLGKVYALKRGASIAEGEWILFTDADIHLKSDTLSKAVRFAQQSKCDHLTLFPKAISHSFLLNTIITAFQVMFLVTVKMNKINNPKTDAAVGVGAFNLVKKNMLKKSAAFSWLRMEVCDDVGLGLAIKKAGGKTSFAFANQHVQLHWYHSIKQMFNGMEKNLFAASAHYNVKKLIFTVTFATCIILGPFISLTYGLYADNSLWILGLTAIAIYPITMFIFNLRLKNTQSSSLLLPLGMLVILIMIVNSGVKCIKRGGIVWRGTLYPLEMLRKLRRVGL